jgi:hypothetical protein
VNEHDYPSHTYSGRIEHKKQNENAAVRYRGRDPCYNMIMRQYSASHRIVSCRMSPQGAIAHMALQEQVPTKHVIAYLGTPYFNLNFTDSMSVVRYGRPLSTICTTLVSTFICLIISMIISSSNIRMDAVFRPLIHILPLRMSAWLASGSRYALS